MSTSFLTVISRLICNFFQTHEVVAMFLKWCEVIFVMWVKQRSALRIFSQWLDRRGWASKMRAMAERYLRKRPTVWDACLQQTRTILWLMPGTEFWAPDEISSSSEMWDKTSVPLLLQKQSFTISLLSRLAWPPLNLLFFFETYCFEWQNNQQVSGADNKDAIFFQVAYLVLRATRPSQRSEELRVN